MCSKYYQNEDFNFSLFTISKLKFKNLLLAENFALSISGLEKGRLHGFPFLLTKFSKVRNNLISPQMIFARFIMYENVVSVLFDVGLTVHGRKIGFPRIGYVKSPDEMPNVFTTFASALESTKFLTQYFAEGFDRQKANSEIFNALFKRLKSPEDEEYGEIPDHVRLCFLTNRKFLSRDQDPYCLISNETNELDTETDPQAYPSLYRHSRKLHNKGALELVTLVFDPHMESGLLEIDSDNENTKLYNLYKTPTYRKAQSDKDALKPILRFVEHVIPCKKSRQMFYDWVALSLNAPAPVMLGLFGNEGTGKSLLCKVVALLHGEDNRVLLNSNFGGNRFQQNFDKITLAIGEEVYTERGVSKERMKSMVEKFTFVERKGKDAITVKNTTSFILNSNRYDCVPWTGSSDRKFCVLDIRKEPASPELIEDLAKVCGFVKQGQDVDPDFGALKAFYLTLKKRFSSGLKTDFSKRILTSTYEQCFKSSLGRSKRYLYDLLLGESHEQEDLWDVLNHEEQLQKGRLPLRKIYEAYCLNKRRISEFIRDETAKEFLKTVTKNGKPIAKVRELKNDLEITILQGPLRYEKERKVTWPEYIEGLEL